MSPVSCSRIHVRHSKRMAIERKRVIPARRTRIPSLAVFLLALAVRLILGMAMIPALRVVWPSSPKTGQRSW
jgi:hypothetical protein